nr:MAG TPA: hypothetical protein [Inoviridae sp.]
MPDLREPLGKSWRSLQSLCEFYTDGRNRSPHSIPFCKLPVM